jgi:hypothetical protein
MKKPLNKLSCALWIAALIFAFADVWAFWKASLYDPYNGRIPLHTNVVELLRQMVESVLYISGTFTAFGGIIELLDQIRWNTMPHKDGAFRPE